MPQSYDSFRIKATLPDEMAPLNELAYNLHWTWSHEAIDLFRRGASLLAGWSFLCAAACPTSRAHRP